MKEEDDRPLHIKIVAGAVMLVLLAVLSPILVLMFIFELMPYRRNQIRRFQRAILDALQVHGETEARTLRGIANAQAKTRIGAGTFYALMSRFIDQGAVTMHKAEDMLHGQPVTKTTYTLTPRGGWDAHTFEGTPEAVARVIGSLRPSPT